MAGGAGCAFDPAAAIHDGDAAGGKQRQRRRIDPVLDREHARGKRRRSSSSATATAPCAMIGPASISGTTKCTVAPWILRAGRERARMGVEALEGRQQRGVDIDHAALPLPTNPGVRIRMKPARHTMSMWCAAQTSCSACSKPRGPCRIFLWSTTAVAMPAALAALRCPRRRPFETTRTISAGIAFVSSQLRSAPPCWSRGRKSERRRVCGPCSAQIQLAVIGDPCVTGGLGDFCRSRTPSRRLRRTAATPCQHRARATTAIMPTPQLKVRSISFCAMPPCLRQPLEHREHRYFGKIDAGAETVREHARNIVGKTAAGDMAERFYRLGRADRSEARLHIELGRRDDGFAQRLAGRKGQARPISVPTSRPPFAPANSRWNARRTTPARSERHPHQYRRAAATGHAPLRRPQSRPGRNRSP